MCDEKDAEPEPRTSTTLATKKPGSGVLQKLVLSCSQREFRKFAEGRAAMSSKTATVDLHLVLHFMLADIDVDHLASIIQNSTGLQSLSLEALAIDDRTWTGICKSIRNHPRLKSVQLSFTEKFVDSCRRLTPERRRSRTNDIIKVLNTNKILEAVDWPKFQQDDSLMPRVEGLLMENRKASSSASSTNRLED